MVSDFQTPITPLPPGKQAAFTKADEGELVQVRCFYKMTFGTRLEL